ncbi:MAG TPA: acyltransferase domain-containing protein, partial [Myxococcaceae bacterium]
LQPALVAVSLSAFVALSEAGFEPWAVAGHSLGELSALSAAGALSPEAAVRLAAVRGRAMEREARSHPAGMLAAFAGEEEVSRRLAADPRLELAAANAPDEWVLSGPEEALERVASELPSQRLRVSGGWHSRAMEGAVGDVRDAVERARPVPVRLGAYSGLTGEPVGTGADLAELLSAQLVRPVRFAALLRRLAADGAALFIAMGSGRALGGLVRKNLARAAILRVEEPADVDRVLAKAGR